MNLYLLSQSVNNNYDTYDSVVVCAESLEDAKTIHPWSRKIVIGEGDSYQYDDWAQVSDIEGELIGVAAATEKRGVILASFNAG